MNASNAAQYLPLVKALAEEKKIQLKLTDGSWIETEPDFSCPPSHYRIKPEPRDFWLVGGAYFQMEESAQDYASRQGYKEIILTREVL